MGEQTREATITRLRWPRNTCDIMHTYIHGREAATW